MGKITVYSKPLQEIFSSIQNSTISSEEALQLKAVQLKGILIPQLVHSPEYITSITLPALKAHGEQHGLTGLSDVLSASLSVLDKVDPVGAKQVLSDFSQLLGTAEAPKQGALSFFGDFGKSLADSGLLFGPAGFGLPNLGNLIFGVGFESDSISFLGSVSGTDSYESGSFSESYKDFRKSQLISAAPSDQQKATTGEKVCKELLPIAVGGLFAAAALPSAGGSLLVGALATGGTALLKEHVCGFYFGGDKPAGGDGTGGSGVGGGGDGGGGDGGDGGGGGGGDGGDGTGGSGTDGGGTGSGGTDEPQGIDPSEGGGEESENAVELTYPDPTGESGSGGGPISPEMISLKSSSLVNPGKNLATTGSDVQPVFAANPFSTTFALVLLRAQATVEKWKIESIGRLPAIPGLKSMPNVMTPKIGGAVDSLPTISVDLTGIYP